MYLGGRAVLAAICSTYIHSLRAAAMAAARIGQPHQTACDCGIVAGWSVAQTY